MRLQRRRVGEARGLITCEGECGDGVLVGCGLAEGGGREKPPLC